MLKNPQTEEQMIAEGAEFKVDHMYYKLINGTLHRARKEDEEWIIAYHSRSDYKGMTGFVDLRAEAKKKESTAMKNELYASLELQITMAQDYSEWLKQETKRNDELLNAHSTALRRLNGLMVQSPSEEENVDSGRGEELPDGLKWEDAPEWATYLGEVGPCPLKIWYNSREYAYLPNSNRSYAFGNTYNRKLEDVKFIATRPEGV